MDNQSILTAIVGTMSQGTKITFLHSYSGSVVKNLAPLQNQKKPLQFGKLIIFIKTKMIHKGENYSVKLQKYYFCTEPYLISNSFPLLIIKYF